MAESNGSKSMWLKVIIGFLFALIMGAYTLAGAANIKATASETDISWIKASLTRIEDSLKINK